jgi:metallophosphoesterase (TIGR03767 family)
MTGPPQTNRPSETNRPSRAPRPSRRAFLGGAAVAGAGALWAPLLWTPARAAAERAALAVAVDPTGTTLAETIVRQAPSGYSRLTAGPGWPTVVRTDLATPSAGRADTRRPLATVVHLTDIHVVDTQSPGRVEFVDPIGEPFTAAFRPQEVLTTQVQSAMVRRLNSIGRGPIAGRRFDCAVSTGDNIDNQQHNELDWFLTLLDGGTVSPDSGTLGVYEGVQAAAWADPRYWHPDPGTTDVFRTDHGFGDMPGLLEAGIAPFATPALGCRWFSTYGNHDGLVQGNLPTSPPLDDIMTGSIKPTDLPPGMTAAAFLVAMFTRITEVRDDIATGTYPHQVVTADPTRRTVSPPEWVQAHLDAPALPGPAGHGYTTDHLDSPGVFYDFEIVPGVLGISLDTGGYNSGTIGQAQLDWLEATLRSVSSRWFDPAGHLVRTGATDQLVMVFSHFNARSMDGSPPDPARPDERRYTGDEVVAFLHRFPNVVAWVNGHHHVNRIEPMPDPTGRTQGFWDINTCSHVDWPQQSRIVELVDNADATLSIFCTMVEHAGPAVVDAADTSVLGLASLNRELAANDPQSDPASRLGRIEDLNVELVLPVPFAVEGIASSPTTTSTTAPAHAALTPAFTG